MNVVFAFVIVFVFVIACFVGQVMSPHHSDQMSQRSQLSRVTLCFLSRTYGPTDIGRYRAVSDKVWIAKKK